ncbi:MAG: hypothetical protein E7294_00940 [Lachnospiraceae bacterium]|jgi:hypothetical protein|nr:hypothetical protein [Lachnospiraceae bacterium]
MIKLRENDFKYVIQDISHVYIGARMNYEEVGEHYDTPARLKSAIYRCIMEETPIETLICDHLLAIKKGSKSYYVYHQLGAKIKVGYFVKKVDKKGREQEEYISRKYSFDDFMEEQSLWEKDNDYIIQEIYFSKRKLMSLAI